MLLLFDYFYCVFDTEKFEIGKEFFDFIFFDRFNLYQYFPKIISCAEVGKGKSHPDVFIAAEKYLGTTRDDTWVFEDSFVALQTAKNAGFQTVGVFDKHNFGSVGVADVSTIYIGEGESFHRIIEQI